MKKKKIVLIFTIWLFMLSALIVADNVINSSRTFTLVGRQTYNRVKTFAKENNLKMTDYTADLLSLLERNSETEDFVLNYPLEKDKVHNVDLSEIGFDKVPLFMQWDKRWGYKEFSGQLAALSGCGPVCLSMAAMYTLEDVSLHPAFMIDFAIENGYSTEGSGSLHSLIYKGGAELGLNVYQLEKEKAPIVNQLEKKNAVICLMGPGDFTAKGHFVVFAGLKDGKIIVNDPNSYKNSEKLWDMSDLLSQIRKAWVVVKY